MTALLPVRDNAAWHVIREVRAWLRAYDRPVEAAGKGARIVGRRLPVKSPWLSPIAPKWVRGKCRACSPLRTPTTRRTAERACAALGCAYEPHLALRHQVTRGCTSGSAGVVLRLAGLVARVADKLLRLLPFVALAVSPGSAPPAVAPPECAVGGNTGQRP